jgi:hypothetical protein
MSRREFAAMLVAATVFGMSPRSASADAVPKRKPRYEKPRVTPLRAWAKCRARGRQDEWR